MFTNCILQFFVLFVSFVVKIILCSDSFGLGIVTLAFGKLTKTPVDRDHVASLLTKTP